MDVSMLNEDGALLLLVAINFAWWVVIVEELVYENDCWLVNHVNN